MGDIYHPVTPDALYLPTRPKKQSRLLSRAPRILRLVTRDGLFCCWCGKPLELTGRQAQANLATVEHVTPKSLGGTNNPDNLKVACFTCNNERRSNLSWAPK